MVSWLARWWPVLVGLPVLVGGGLLHGLWTGRWSPSPELALAAEKLAALPDDLGPWKGEAYELEPEALGIAGAAGHYSRTFTDPATGEKVLVILLCGRPAQMAVHRPEDCYKAAGYHMAEQADRIKAQAAGGDVAEMFTGTFQRDEASGPTRLRIFWSWFGGARQQWEAPDSPRFHFAREPVLYKLYVIQNVTGQEGAVAQGPAIRLLGELLPLLSRRMKDKDVTTETQRAQRKHREEQPIHHRGTEDTENAQRRTRERENMKREKTRGGEKREGGKAALLLSSSLLSSSFSLLCAFSVSSVSLW